MILIGLIVFLSLVLILESQLLHADEQLSLHPRVEVDRTRASDGDRSVTQCRNDVFNLTGIHFTER